MTELMNAVILTGYGGPEKLVYTQVPKPIPQKGEVLIEVGACSVNNTDINTRTGWYAAEAEFQEILQDTKKNDEETSTGWSQSGIRFPRIQGADIVGKVVGVGAGVSQELLQQRVIVDPWVRGESFGDYKYVGSELNGGFAEYSVVPAVNVCPIQSSLSDVELATVPCSYSTAENLLTKGRVASEDLVLIMGASGGVGSSAIKLAKIRGATVIAIVGANKEHLARDCGADYVYPRNEQLAANLANHEITVGIDVVGGEYFETIVKALSIGGRYVTAGAIAGPMVSLDLRDLIYKDIEMIGATRFRAEVFQNLLGYIEQGLLYPSVARVFSLSKMEEAQKFFQSKIFFGKVVITPENKA
ncbi:alcohol dehydrogenase family protein [Roseofilum casamattae]|uniref:Alcohol dehydrogenase family protein n=1 Tax=Roseofilum casamattae BLCC-M143 TaxID=3022442 RepID=A0ABT7BW23_9CYAN|nr:alcohol dehydrogenase family protein [Roseofilum casamattae]MDJ1183386.1 alcohol dehydrogenase family protein [Roseofilum casamattae BLCC-M143]